MSRHFRLMSEFSGAIAKRLPYAKNRLSAPISFFNQFVTEIHIYTHKSSFNSKDIVYTYTYTSLSYNQELIFSRMNYSYYSIYVFILNNIISELRAPLSSQSPRYRDKRLNLPIIDISNFTIINPFCFLL